MTHYVLLKLSDQADKDAVWRRVCDTYAALDKELPFLHDPVVHRSCVERDTNADIMAVIKLDDPSQLQTYLTHPLHTQMAADLKEQIIGRTSFDHE